MINLEDIHSMSPDALVSWFLIGSYAYYELSNPVMSDPDFDVLVSRLKEKYAESDHYHKSLITQSHLDATTGYDIKYPTIVRYAAMNYLKEIGRWHL